MSEEVVRKDYFHNTTGTNLVRASANLVIWNLGRRRRQMFVAIFGDAATFVGIFVLNDVADIVVVSAAAGAWILRHRN